MLFFWVVGARGMLGSACCRFLQREKIPFLATSSKVDICNKEAIATVIKEHPHITHILNCAAYTQVDGAEEEMDKAFALNVRGVENLAFAAKKLQAKLISFSTDYVFDGNRSSPYREEASTHPLNVYGRTKREGEIALLSILPTALIIRTSWLFGVEGNHFVKKMVQLMQTHETVSVVDDQFGRPTYAEDIAQNIFAFLPLEGIYHFANKGETSWFTFALEIAKRAPFALKCSKILPISSRDYPTKATRPKYSVLSTEKIEKIKIVPREYTFALEEYFSS